jgi:hypothetical protein
MAKAPWWDHPIEHHIVESTQLNTMCVVYNHHFTIYSKRNEGNTTHSFYNVEGCAGDIQGGLSKIKVPRGNLKGKVVGNIKGIENNDIK